MTEEYEEDSDNDLVDFLHYDPDPLKGRKDEIKQSFIEKALDYPEKIREEDADSPTDGASPTRAAPCRRSKKRRERDIFRAFGREHDLNAMQEVEIGGVVRQRANYTRFWEHEEDLDRWHRALHSSSRHDRLLFDVKTKWHPDIKADTVELKERHNMFYRGHAKGPKMEDPAIQLRELQKQIAPKENKKKNKFEVLLGFGSRLGHANSEPTPFRPSQLMEQPSQAKRDPPPMSQRSHSSTEQRSRHSQPLHSNPSSFLYGVKETAPSDSGASPLASPLGSPLNLSRRPSVSQTDRSRRPSGSSSESPVKVLATDSVVTDSLDMHTETTRMQMRQRQPDMPKTMKLMLFRNADKLHTGENAFLKKWPVANFSDLLVVCSKACRPVVPPAEALFTMDLKPVRSLDEIFPGCAYLLKGKESLDPPQLFFSYYHSLSPSQRKLAEAGNANVADNDHQRQQGSSMSPSVDRIPSVGSPPSQSEMALFDAYRGMGSRAWGVDNRLGMILSWGGLSHPPHRHHDFRSWPSALATSGRGSLMGGSMSAPSLTMAEC